MRSTLKEFATLRRLLFLGVVWLLIGFVSGTLILLGPAGWVTGAVARAGGGQGAQDLAMTVVILSYVALSFVASIWLARVLLRRPPGPRFLAVAGLTVLAGVALWGWSNPARFSAMSGATMGSDLVAAGSGARFVFGPYPDRAKLEELKEEGITAVVSLQHPAVVPIEPQGIAAEKATASELGIDFIHAPMLPWISDNEAALETIRTLAREGEGTYYVHCGLGRDRVGVVRRALEEMGATTAGSLEESLTWGDRDSEGLGDLERGPVHELQEDVWLVPYPNPHEMFGHMLAGQVAHALLVLDEDRDDERAWSEEARREFETYGLAWSAIDPGESADVGAAVRAAVDTLPRPLTVVTGRTEPGSESPAARSILAAWRDR